MEPISKNGLTSAAFQSTGTQTFLIQRLCITLTGWTILFLISLVHDTWSWLLLVFLSIPSIANTKFQPTLPWVLSKEVFWFESLFMCIHSKQKIKGSILFLFLMVLSSLSTSFILWISAVSLDSLTDFLCLIYLKQYLLFFAIFSQQSSGLPYSVFIFNLPKFHPL